MGIWFIVANKFLTHNISLSLKPLFPKLIKSPTSDKKKKAKKVIDSSEEEEEEEEDDADLDDYLEQMKKRRAEAMGNGGNDDTKGKKKAKPTNNIIYIKHLIKSTHTNETTLTQTPKHTQIKSKAT